MRRFLSLLITSFFFFLMACAAAEEYPAAAAETESSEEIILFVSAEEDEEDLASAYIFRNLPRRTAVRASSLSGFRLPEPDRSLYTCLQTCVSQTAAGERSSTEFFIPYGDVFKNTFTAEELGIDHIREDGSITQEAKTAASAAMLQNRNALHPGTAVLCLITDTPYELYWYDKTEGHGTKISYSTTAYSATDSTITVKGNIIIRMSVSRDYAVQTFSADGEVSYAEYEADPLYGTSVRAAAENAEAILAANRDKSDEEKLAAYRDAICAMTEYNHEASESDPYGDPWQLVWVFDGKPNTKVVCEGYAKAFQYLCDLGTTEATAITVQGRTSGPHMWNIVSIAGHRYLADLTNCDLGYDLFLRGALDGSPATGYIVPHGKGTMRYTYNEDLIWNEADLTLYRKDYRTWKAAVEKTPEIQVSSGILFSGYDAAVRLQNEDPSFPPSALRIHRVSEGGTEEEITEEPVPADGFLRISAAGTYSFTVIRDGKESQATEPVILTESDFPEGPGIRLPAGAEIQAEAFAGNESMIWVNAADCVIRADAFADSGVQAARLAGQCTVEPGAFESTVILCMDGGKNWMEEYQFLIAE